MKYYCDCNEHSGYDDNVSNIESLKLKLKEVNVDENDCCVHCGYTAVASRINLADRSSAGDGYCYWKRILNFEFPHLDRLAYADVCKYKETVTFHKRVKVKKQILDK